MSVNCISGKAMKWTHLRIHLRPFWRGGYYLMDRLPNLPVIITAGYHSGYFVLQAYIIFYDSYVVLQANKVTRAL